MGDFRDGIDDNSDLFLSPFDGRKMCGGVMKWIIKSVLKSQLTRNLFLVVY
jgi:hypothetical protein